MKYFCVIIIFLTFFSCDNKYEGNWTSDYLKETTETPKSVTFKGDSIAFNFWAFNHYHKYPLKIKRKELWFNNLRVNTKVFGDTLSLNNINYYVKDENDSISRRWFGDPMVEINLPKNNTTLYEGESSLNKTAIHYYLFYGKRLDNNVFSLQLNDKYAEITEIPSFLASGHRNRHLPLPVSILFIEKSTKLSDIEKLFHQHQKINFLKIKLVNNINLKHSDSLGFYYEYETLYKRLPPMFGNDTYSPDYSRIQTPPPQPQPVFEEDKSNVIYFILKDNSIFHNKKIIISSEVAMLAEKAINENHAIISLYDLASNYEGFLKMNALIDGVYNKKRNDLALKKFSKSFVKLETEQATEIKQKIPLKHLWSYSISHYQDVTKNNKSFFGLKVKPIDSLLPQ